MSEAAHQPKIIRRWPPTLPALSISAKKPPSARGLQQHKISPCVPMQRPQRLGLARKHLVQRLGHQKGLISAWERLALIWSVPSACHQRKNGILSFLPYFGNYINSRKLLFRNQSPHLRFLVNLEPPNHIKKISKHEIKGGFVVLGSIITTIHQKFIDFFKFWVSKSCSS